jgi:hypothetical protein
MSFKISEHDKKVVMIGATIAAAMVLYAYIVEPWATDWRKTRAAIATNQKTIASLASSVERRMNQATIVPVLEMPVEAEKQQLLFKTKMNEQLIAAGVQAKSLQYVTIGKTPNELGFTTSKLKCDGKCNMAAAIKLLGSLGENPYLTGIDELRLSCDPQKREEMTLSITVSTFCKN